MVIQIKVDVVMIMNRNEDRQRLLAAIQSVHDNTILDFEIQRRLIRAVKQLKKGDLPSYVAYCLVDELSCYFVMHPGQKQDPYVTQIYDIANEIQRKYRGFFFYP